MDNQSSKQQAEDIIVAVKEDVQGIEQQDAATQTEVYKQAGFLLDKLFSVISKVDLAAAEARVKKLREKYPNETSAQLTQRLVRYKCQQTGAVGAATAGAGVIPGIGTATAMTLGVAADIGATFKLQAELVLQIAAVYNYPLTEAEKQQVVMLITGLSAGTSTVARQAGEKITLAATEKFAGKAVLKALPIIGMIASAGTNALSTYLIGQRAETYFSQGPEAMTSWGDSLRAITGVDEREISSWLAESSKATGSAIVQGAHTVGETGKAAIATSVQKVSEASKTVGGAIASGATTVRDTSKTAIASGVDLASEAGKTVGGAIASGATTVRDSGKTAIASGVDLASEAGKTVGGAIASGATTVRDSGKTAIASGVDMASEAGKAIASGAGKVAAMPQAGLYKIRDLFWQQEASEQVIEGNVLAKSEFNLNELIYPLTFTPVFKDYIWGGRNLETVLGREIPDGVVAESWDISGHASSPTTVNNGSLTGKTLPEVMRLLGLNLVGRRSEAMLQRGKFPLLIKLLDANQPLSVQVHPNDVYAQQHEQGELGKTEMWYILQAEPGAQLIYGLARETTPETFAAALQAGQLERCLHYLPIEAGQAVFIPAGSLHAILGGIVLVEIQQNSDTTYRVYDWNRLGVDRQPRPLHVDKAMQVINFKQIEPQPYPIELIKENDGVRRELITHCPEFQVERVTFKADGIFRGQCSGNTFEIWGAMSGAGQINWGGQSLELQAVHFTLLPATLGDFEIKVHTAGEWLRVYVP